MQLKYDKYPAYKDSGYEWVGDIPENWKVEKGKWLFSKNERGVRKEDEVVTCFRDGEVTLRTNRRTSGFTNSIKEHGYQGIRKGDLVIHAMDAFAGAIGVSDSDGKSTPVYSACTPRFPKIVNQFFYAYYLRNLALNGVIESLAKGIRERSTDFRFNDFGELQIALPTLEEQSTIAQHLDQKTKKIDQAITQKEKMIALLKERKQIMIQELVTGKIVWDKETDSWIKPKQCKDSGVVWIGEIPVGWEVKKLKYVAKIIDCKNRTPEYFDKGDYFVVRTSNVKNGILINDQRLYTDAKNYQKWTERGVPIVNSVLFTREAPAGEACLVPEGTSLCLGQRMMSISGFNNQLNNKYLLFQVYSPVIKTYINLVSSGSTVTHLRVPQVYDMPIICPKIHEQNKIVSKIEILSIKIDQAIALQLKQIECLKEYKMVLIDSLVTGKVKI